LAKLRESRVFQGGSSIGDGICVTKSDGAPCITQHLSGYIKVKTQSIEHVRALVVPILHRHRVLCGAKPDELECR
jgi:hypothetical protein